MIRIAYAKVAYDNRHDTLANRQKHKEVEPVARVLVIEDSDFARKIISKMLRTGGHEVMEAEGGYQGVEQIEQFDPECITLDLLMPEMDGFEVLSTLKTKGLGAPVIVLSADVQDTTKKKCEDLGAFEFIEKPANEKKLLNVVQRAIESKKGT